MESDRQEKFRRELAARERFVLDGVAWDLPVWIADRIRERDAHIAELEAELTKCRQDHIDVIENVVQRTLDAVLALPRWRVRECYDGVWIHRNDIEALRKEATDET